MAVRSSVLPLMFAAALAWPVAAQQVAGPSFRIVESATGAIVDLEVLATRLAAADVVFLGEQHDDETTHRVQRLLLEAVAEQRNNVSLALEMFERDVQEPLDHFQMGHTSEAEFLAEARAWPRYARDYKPLVDFAITREWAVVAANVPRPLAAEVAKAGLAVLAGRSDTDRRLFAADLRCDPAGDYFHRFVAALGTHGQTLDETARVRYYESQCLKDETMAESIARAVEAHDAPVVHMNGAFHSNYRLGTVSRVKRRVPGARIAVVSFVPVADLDRADGKSRRKLGDWVVFTLETPRPPKPDPAPR